MGYRVLDITEEDKLLLIQCTVSDEIINIIDKRVFDDEDDDTLFLTVDGILIYYNNFFGSYYKISDSRDHYRLKDYLEVGTIQEFARTFGYVNNNDLDTLVVFHKKEKIRKLINKL
jgi:hypothetical protein